MPDSRPPEPSLPRLPQAPGEPIPLHPGAPAEFPGTSNASPEAEANVANAAAPPAAGDDQALRLARLRSQIAAGRYRPTAEEIARAMVEHATG